MLGAPSVHAQGLAAADLQRNAGQADHVGVELAAPAERAVNVEARLAADPFYVGLGPNAFSTTVDHRPITDQS